MGRLHGGSWVLSAPRWLFVDGVKQRTGTFPGGMINTVAMRADVPLVHAPGKVHCPLFQEMQMRLGGGGGRACFGVVGLSHEVRSLSC